MTSSNRAGQLLANSSCGLEACLLHQAATLLSLCGKVLLRPKVIYYWQTQIKSWAAGDKNLHQLVTAR